MVKLGILGAGKIASVMAETVRALNDAGNHEVELTLVGSRSADKAQKLITDAGIATARPCGSYEELVASKDVDLIYVATPHNFHHDHALLAIRHQKHVLVEKAFTVNTADAQDIFENSDKHHVLATEGIWTRYQPMRQMIADEIAAGKIGTPLMLSADLGYNLSQKERIIKPELAGGALLDLGVYALNFAVMFFGHPSSVEASCTRSALGLDMQENFCLTYDDGRMASLHATCLAVTRRGGVIAGSKGYIEVDNINNPERYRIYGTKYELLKAVERPQQFTGFEYELLETARAIEQGKTECASMPHAETVYMMQLMDSVRSQFGIRYPFER